MTVPASDLHKNDTILLDGVFYHILDRRPDGKGVARFQLRTVAGTTIQLDIPSELEIEVIK